MKLILFLQELLQTLKDLIIIFLNQRAIILILNIMYKPNEQLICHIINQNNNPPIPIHRSHTPTNRKIVPKNFLWLYNKNTPKSQLLNQNKFSTINYVKPHTLQIAVPSFQTEHESSSTKQIYQKSRQFTEDFPIKYSDTQNSVVLGEINMEERENRGNGLSPLQFKPSRIVKTTNTNRNIKEDYQLRPQDLLSINNRQVLTKPLHKRKKIPRQIKQNPLALISQRLVIGVAPPQRKTVIVNPKSRSQLCSYQLPPLKSTTVRMIDFQLEPWQHTSSNNDDYQVWH